VAELYLRGYRSQRAIAERMEGVSRATIGRDLQVIRKWWKEDAVGDFDAAVAEELARIDRIEREAWDAWERSKAPSEKQRTAKTTRDDSSSSIAQIEKENRCGDPRYLDVVWKCVDKRSKLLGLEAPTKLNIDSETIDKAIEALEENARQQARLELQTKGT